MGSLLKCSMALHSFARDLLGFRFLVMRGIATGNAQLNKADSNIVNIDMNKMMDEDYEPLGDSTTMMTSSKDLAGAPLAPVDIDPWILEEDEVETLDKDPDREPIEYPPIPKERPGKYVFKGIKVWLPKDMLQPATYRHRLEPEDQENLADDIRICRFQK